MRNLVLVIFISLLSINSLFAQKREHTRVMPKLSRSYVLPLKHNKTDSLYHTRPQFKYIYLRHKNQHIDDPHVRYALDNLKKERMKYYELYKAINTLSDYAENEHIKYMLNYVRNYFETVQAKEEAIRQIQDRIKRDSIDFYKEHPGTSVDSKANCRPGSVIFHTFSISALYILKSTLTLSLCCSGNVITANDSRAIAFRKLPPSSTETRIPYFAFKSHKKRFRILMAFPLPLLISSPECPPWSPFT